MSASPAQDWFEKDFYKTLEVAESATDKDISKAYKKLARKYHPDQNPDDPTAEDRFKEVSRAYEVVGDPETRAAYDQARKLGPVGAGFGPRAGGGGGQSFHFEDVGDIGDISDLLGGLFGGGRTRGGASGFGFGPRRGQDIHANLPMDFADAVNGVETTITLDTGAGPRKIKVRIPAGVKDGQTIRLAGKGGPGAEGGPAGDLLIDIAVRPHKLFGRTGNNLTITVPVTFPEAALGADIKVPTLGGPSVTVRIPEGTSSGKTLRVKGKGVKNGDLLVTVEVAVPTNLSKVERKAIEALRDAEERHDSPRRHLDG